MQKRSLTANDAIATICRGGYQGIENGIADASELDRLAPYAGILSSNPVRGIARMSNVSQKIFCEGSSSMYPDNSMGIALVTFRKYPKTVLFR